MVPLTAELAMEAAAVGLALGLPLADSIVHATAAATEGVVWTHDADFKDLPHVHSVARRTTM